MNAERSTITLADGRTVEVLTEGPPDGLPLVINHGTPGGGLVIYPPKAETEHARGLRTIHFARPGYGQSTPRAGRSVADVAGDVAEILDALGAGRFITSGSLGRRPARARLRRPAAGPLLAAATIAGVAPSDARAWTGWPGWGRRTSRSSVRRSAVRPTSPPTWKRRRPAWATSPAPTSSSGSAA